MALCVSAAGAVAAGTVAAGAGAGFATGAGFAAVEVAGAAVDVIGEDAGFTGAVGPVAGAGFAGDVPGTLEATGPGC